MSAAALLLAQTNQLPPSKLRYLAGALLLLVASLHFIRAGEALRVGEPAIPRARTRPARRGMELLAAALAPFTARLLRRPKPRAPQIPVDRAPRGEPANTGMSPAAQGPPAPPAPAFVKPGRPAAASQEFAWGPKAAPPPGRRAGYRVRWVRVAGLVALAAIAAAAGRASAPDHTERLVSLEREVDQLKAATHTSSAGTGAALGPSGDGGATQTATSGTAPSPAPAAPAASAPPSPAGGARTYVVEQGDTLFGIARRFYGDVSFAPAIAEANSISFEEPLRVGKKLRLPPP